MTLSVQSYKLVGLGIGDKTWRWIASFIHFHHLNILWKSFHTCSAHWFHGVPQGSVFSPFFFLLYMLDISETHEAGVHLKVYVEDDVLYVIDPNKDCAGMKIQNTLACISTWCHANKLFIEPSKCYAIYFSHCRDPGEPLKLQSVDLSWQTHVKILGVWFLRTLRFTYHFNTVKFKISKRINYLKAFASHSRGITSFHMLRIVNSLIRSSLEYAAPLFYDSPPSAINILEVSYNATIRLAMPAYVDPYPCPLSWGWCVFHF